MRLTKFADFGKKIICIGRNYVDHVNELKNVVPEKPLIFLKPSTAYVTEGNPIKIPEDCNDMHHEVELGILIGKKCSKISESEASDYIGGYTLALDMTARDLQDKLKKNGQPWSIAKSFDTSCPVGRFVPREQIANPENLEIWCSVRSGSNGEVELRQKGQTNNMIFKMNYLISYISKYFTLEIGDLILTGTPKGVGPVKSTDVIECGLVDLETKNTLIKMQFTVE